MGWLSGRSSTVSCRAWRDDFIAKGALGQDVVMVAILVSKRDGQGPDRIDQFDDALVEFGRDWYNRHTEQGFQAIEMQQIAPLFDFVHHVQRHDHRPAQFFKLEGQVQVALEIAGIDDVDDHIRLVFQDVIAGDNFLDRIRGKRVDTGQIDQGEQVGPAPDHTDFLFNGYTGPVARCLPCACQPVEEGCFTAVWVASQSQVDVH